MSEVEFFGGLRVIGSSKIMVSTPTARVFLDMGLDIPAERDLFRAPVAERERSRLADRLAVGHAPSIPGLYDPAQLPASSALAVPDPRESAVFLSHAHLDHDGALGFIRPEVPVYASPWTVTLEHAANLAGTGFTGPGANSSASQPSLIPMLDPVRVGDLLVEAVPVDHDIRGACGFIVHTPDGSLAYTGDLNFHRNEGHRSHAFIRAARAVTMLVTETTMLSFYQPTLSSTPASTGEPGDGSVQGRGRGAGQRNEDGQHNSDPFQDIVDTNEEAGTGPRSEDEVDQVFAQALAQAPGLALVSLYERDTERAARFIQVARDAGRTLVWTGQQAAFLAAAGVPGAVTWDASRAQRPVHTRAIHNLKSAGHPDSGHATVQLVSLAEVTAAPSSFVVQPDVQDPAALLDLVDGRGEFVPFIHSQGEPLGPFMAQWEPWVAWLEQLGVSYMEAGSSGHASALDLVRMVESIQPGVVVPLHGFRPEALEVSMPVLLPEYGVRYRLDGTVI